MLHLLEPISSTTQYYNSFLVKISLVVICIIFFITTVAVVVVCCLMKQKYERKLRAERAMAKTFGFGTKYGADGLLHYSQHLQTMLLIRQSLSPQQPGGGATNLTNMYTYEGTNPIWLKKYDKMETEESSTDTSTCSKTDKNLNSPNTINTVDEISAFYLKQGDSTFASREVRHFENININNNINNNNTNMIYDSSNQTEESPKRADKSLSITSNDESMVGDNVCILKPNEIKSNNSILNCLSFSTQTAQKLNNNRKTSMLKDSNTNTNNDTDQNTLISTPNTINTNTNITNDINCTNNNNQTNEINNTPIPTPTPVINNTQNQSTTSLHKDCSDLYALESTII